MPSGHAGADPARFAAANLPPYKAPPAGQETSADDEPTGLSPEVMAARAAAARYDALYGDGVRQSRWRSPLLIMSLVFAVGAGAGLAGAKWYASTSKNPGLPPQSVALNAPVTAADPDGQARALRGIRASELPYDGRVPDDGGEAAPQASKAEQAPPAPEPRKEAPPPPEKPAAQAPANPPEPRPAPSRASAKPEASKPEAASRPTREARRAEAAPRKPERTAKAAREKENDKEVERMRRQADDELTRKTAAASATSRRGTEVSSKAQQVSSALQSCERRPNIILREHCRWQVCNGMWGKNGCPSYASARRDPYAY